MLFWINELLQCLNQVGLNCFNSPGYFLSLTKLIFCQKELCTGRSAGSTMACRCLLKYVPTTTNIKKSSHGVPIGHRWFLSATTQGLLYRWTEHWADFFEEGKEKRHPKLHPGDGDFGSWSFITLKNSHQDLSNEGSNFILSSLEVGQWVAQTWPFFDKLLEVADFDLYH